jgi:hypothetical protein
MELHIYDIIRLRVNRVLGEVGGGKHPFGILHSSALSLQQQIRKFTRSLCKEESYLLVGLQDITAVLHSKKYYNSFAKHSNISRRCGSYGRLIFKNRVKNGHRNMLSEHNLR